jgi:putative flippase GtrA
MSTDQKSKFERFKGWWVTRSLAVGAATTCIDVSVSSTALFLGKRNGLDGTVKLALLEGPLSPTLNLTSCAAMLGGVSGTIATYVLSRSFAFKDSDASVSKSAPKFLAAIVAGMLIHGQVVYFLRDVVGVAFVPAKILADMLVFLGPQLVVLRWVVFPKRKTDTV